MAMNGRQKRKLIDLMQERTPLLSDAIDDDVASPADDLGDEPVASFTSQDPRDMDIAVNGANPLDILRMVIAQVESGALDIRNLRMETFREPQRGPSYREVAGMYERPLVPMDCFASMTFEVYPTGRGSDVSPRSREGYVEFNENGDIVARVPPRDKVVTPAAPAAPRAPAGAAPAREIIFDDEGDGVTS